MAIEWISGSLKARNVWSDGLFTLTVHCPGVAGFEPGQFLQVGMQLPEKHLHRPYSVASPHGEDLEFFIIRVDGGELTPALRADMRVAAVYATDVARSCAEWAHLVAGTTSIREGSKLERAFRDIYTGTQHAFISEKVAIDAAQIWLGIIEDQPGL